MTSKKDNSTLHFGKIGFDSQLVEQQALDRAERKIVHSVEVRPNHFEEMSDKLVERCNGDLDSAGFFHCLGRALAPKDNQVDSKYLKANLPDM